MRGLDLSADMTVAIRSCDFDLGSPDRVHEALTIRSVGTRIDYQPCCAILKRTSVVINQLKMKLV